MKYLYLKLGIFVILLFAVVISACLLWTPARMWWYVSKLRSSNIHENYRGVKSLLQMGLCGKRALEKALPGGVAEAQFLTDYWKRYEEPIPPMVNPTVSPWLYPLHLASYKGFSYATRIFLKRNANPNASEHYFGSTPLHCAAREGSYECALLLLKYGADVTLKDEDKATPLHWAAKGGQKSVMRILLDHGADPNIQDSDGLTPLHLSTEKNSAEAVKLLLQRGAFPNDKKVSQEPLRQILIPSGKTPLHIAVCNGNATIARYLIESGAALNVIDGFDKTPFDYARNNEMKILLRTYGGKTLNEIMTEMKIRK